MTTTALPGPAPETPSTGAEARTLVERLRVAGYLPQQIARLLSGRVSSRTVYRWWKGDTVPQRASDVDELRKLVVMFVPTAA